MWAGGKKLLLRPVLFREGDLVSEAAHDAGSLPLLRLKGMDQVR